MDFSDRRKNLQKLIMGGQEFLITNPSDILYFTGYRPELAFLMASRERVGLAVFSTDNEACLAKGIEVVTLRKVDELKKLLKCRRIGVDECMPAWLYTKLKKWNRKVVFSSGTINKLRAVKTAEEIDHIKKAIHTTKKTISDVDIYGKTENYVKREIECEFICRGADRAFDPIIASGFNSAFVHHVPGKNIVSKYGFVIIDAGARVGGYCSDITRSFYPPFLKAKKVYDHVSYMQNRLIRNIKPGVKTSSVQKLYEKMMADKGYKTMHSFGHGIGLDVHEKIGDRFKENMVLTVEPGVYIRGFGGCRKEDIVVVKKNRAVKIS
jgi:Xaa-Pro aminopeptidase